MSQTEYEIFKETIREKTKKIINRTYKFKDDGKEMSLSEDRFSDPVEFEKKHHNNILIVGLNPSGEKKDEKLMLQYIPDEDGNLKHFVKSKKQPNGCIYPSYFKPNYDLVKVLNPKMWWSSLNDIRTRVKEYLDKVKANYDERELFHMYIDKELEKDDQRPYLIFCDLINYHETKSEKLKKMLKENYESIAIDIFETYLEFYEPKMIIVTNAFVSSLILKQYALVDNDITSIKIDIKGKVYLIIFSGFVASGKLDKFNKNRLINEIKENKDFLSL